MESEMNNLERLGTIYYIIKQTHYLFGNDVYVSTID